MMLGLDYFTPHQQASAVLCGVECQRLSGIWLFVFAMLCTTYQKAWPLVYPLLTVTCRLAYR